MANRAHRGGDGSDISVAAELGHEAAAGAERAIDAGDHKLGLAHPMQRGIGEHSVELGDEVQRMAVHFAVSPFMRATASSSSLRSTPSTLAPAALISSVSAPSPQPRSRTRSPRFGASIANTAPAIS